MAYTTYTTAALVCGSIDNNGADRAYLLFTEEFGMIWATARSVREERSRQRYALQEFSLIRVSLVKGKGGWRIGSVEAAGNQFLRAKERGQRAALLGLVQLLRRYVHGEEALPAVWSDVEEFLTSSITAPNYQENMLHIFTIRLLYTLGYIPDDAAIQVLLRAPTLQEALIQYESNLAPRLKKLIQHAETVSQL